MAARVLVPPAVVDELDEGLRLVLDLPHIRDLQWIDVVRPAALPEMPFVTDLGPGEQEVLALALEHHSALPVLDDRVARKVARKLGLEMTGTLGLLLDAKRLGRIEHVGPLSSI